MQCVRMCQFLFLQINDCVHVCVCARVFSALSCNYVVVKHVIVMLLFIL